MKRIWTVSVCLLLLLTLPAAFAIAEELGFYITDGQVGLGGGERSSEGFSVEDAIGLAAVGVLESETFSVEAGDPEYTPSNAAPVADADGPYLVAVGGTVGLNGTAYDLDGDPLTYAWLQAPTLGTLSSQTAEDPTYTAGAAAGIAELTLSVDDGILQASASTMLVVYDPSAGFVTGGGWIWSPAGAYAADPTLEGKASFGFVSKYQKGAKVPSGNTEFRFVTADFGFKSTAYDWLVVASAKAQYKGSGTINGAGDYGFLLTAVDGQIGGGGGYDKFRIKIWDKATGTVAYDSQMGAADGASPTTIIGGGSIVIHSK